MRPTERDLMVARAVVGRNVANETDLTALIESLPEPAEQEQAAQDADVEGLHLFREANDGKCWHCGLPRDYHSAVRAAGLIAAARAEEREACAQECERIASGKAWSNAFTARTCASNIRWRSAQDEHGGKGE